MNKNSSCDFKKLIIEPKRKYIYITMDNNATIKCEKQDFSMDININLACKCKKPSYGELGNNNNRCKNCHRLIL